MVWSGGGFQLAISSPIDPVPHTRGSVSKLVQELRLSPIDPVPHTRGNVSKLGQELRLSPINPVPHTRGSVSKLGQELPRAFEALAR
jgi:hypothetical protein